MGMTLSGESIFDEFNFHSSDKQISKASRGELQCINGHRSYFGHGCKQNYQKAFECYLRSAELGNADGMNHVASLYEKGIGCIQNIEEAIKYYQSSADMQNNDAMFNLANLYFDHFVYKDIDKAIKFYKQAAENGQVAAQNALAGLYETGCEPELRCNIELCIKWYRKAANEGFLEAKNNLSVVLLNNSDSNSKEYLQAVTMLKESSNKGHAASQNNLGHCYEFGKGVVKDENEAIKWYQASAAQNYTASFINLGYLQMKHSKYQQAYEYFLKASSMTTSSVDAWYYLGIMHEKGLHVPMSTYLAIEYFEKASAAGHDPSSLKVGNAYFSGSGGVMQNYAKAFEIYKKLALKGNDVAANNLAIIYEEGLGVDVDIEAAQIWYKMSAENGNEDGLRNEERLSLSMGQTIA